METILIYRKNKDERGSLAMKSIQRPQRASTMAK